MADLKPYRLELELEYLPSMNGSRRRHWSFHHKEQQKARTWVALATAKKRPDKPLQQARLTLTRFSSKECDYDNSVTAFKPWVDALVANGILEDDSPRHVERRYLWEPAPRGKGRIRIVVEEA